MKHNNLSLKEAIKLIKKLEKENEKKDKKIAKLEAEKKKLNLELEGMIKKYEKKAEQARRMMAEKYAPKTEKTKKIGKCINEAEQEVKEKKKRKTPTQNFIYDLKKIATTIEIIDFDFEKEGVDRNKVREMESDVFYKIDVVPVEFAVRKVIRKKYCDGEKIYQPRVEEVFPHSPLTPSLAAHIITVKYELAVPIYRYAQYMQEGGFVINEDNLYNYVSKTAQLLKPIYDEMLKALLINGARVIHIDETPLKVINSDKEKCYVFVYATSFWDFPIYIYEFKETRKTEHVYKYLANYDGYVVVDGYSGYNKLPKKQRCFAHLRRKFTDCLKSLSKEDKERSKASKAIELINKLFIFEKTYRNSNYTADQIKEGRNSAEYKEAIKEMDEYILSIKSEKNASLMAAVKYYVNMKKDAYTFLEDGHIDLSNNTAERVVKPFTLGRRNFLFCKTEKGGIETGILYSIVQTAKANGLVVEKYLKYVIENIGHKEVDTLLPWSIDLPKELKIPKEK